MKKHINLLSSRDDNQKRIRIEKALRNGVIFAGLSVFLSIGVLFLLNIREKSKQDGLLAQKKLYLQQQIALAKLRTQAVTVASRVQTAQAVIGSQPPFLDYLSDLNTFLPASAEARLLALSVDSESNGLAQLEFLTETSLQSFLDALETDTSSTKFRKIVVNDLATNFENQKAMTLVTLGIEFYGKQTGKFTIK